jgi:hypothetical protein
MKPNRTMLPPDEGYLQPALVRLGRAISVAGFAGSRNPLASTPAQCSATKSPKRVAFTDVDRLVFARLYHLAPGVLNTLRIVKPETVIRWHRAGLRAYWRRRSGPRGGRPQTPLEIRRLIRDVSLANPLWGAPRIHGELFKLGIEIGQTTVARYMAKERRPPSQGWRTFISNHGEGIAASICLSCRRYHSDFCSACWSCGMTGAKSCGWA